MNFYDELKEKSQGKHWNNIFIAWIMWGAFLIIFPSSFVWYKANMINMSHLDMTKYREKHEIILLFRFDLAIVFFLILITFKFPMYVHTKSTVHRDNLSSSFFSINILPLFYAWKPNLVWK